MRYVNVPSAENVRPVGAVANGTPLAFTSTAVQRVLPFGPMSASVSLPKRLPFTTAPAAAKVSPTAAGAALMAGMMRAKIDGPVSLSRNSAFVQ